MRVPSRFQWTLTAALVAGAAMTPTQAAPVDEIAGSWRVTKAAPAPWATPAQGDTRMMRQGVGRAVLFTPTRIRARGPMGCGKVAYETILLPSRGLFQGGLPEPADVNAERLGLVRHAVPTVRVSCDSGVFDYHFVDVDTMLLGLDNLVWTLDFQPATPREAVHGFLTAHFAGDMAFTKSDTARKARWFTPALKQAIDRYFDTPQPADEPPVINGDPFTDSQEYPRGFGIQRVSLAGKRATVLVWYPDLRRGVKFEMQRTPEAGWRIDDVRPPRHDSLRRTMISVAR